jgi:hypothetical protein
MTPIFNYLSKSTRVQSTYEYAVAPLPVTASSLVTHLGQKNATVGKHGAAAQDKLVSNAASHGHALYSHEEVGAGETELDIFNPVEVEFVSPAESVGAGNNAESFPFPPQTDSLYLKFTRLMKYPDERDMGYEILPFRAPHDQSIFLQRMTDTRRRRNDEADILWLSPTVFVSSHLFHGHNGDIHSSYAFGMSSPWKLLAYNLPQFDSTTRGFSFGSVTDLPLRFFRHVSAPILHDVSSLEIEIRAKTPVDPFLAFIPRTDHPPMPATTVFFPYAFTELLQALSVYPVHRCFRLRVEAGYGESCVKAQELNDLLLGFQFPVHLQVPRDLLYFESVTESFTMNPAFTSLTISTWHAGLSTNMLDGIARSESLTNLAVDCRGWDRNDNTVSILKAVICHALQGSRNLKCLTLVAHCGDLKSKSLGSMQGIFDRLSRDLDLPSCNRHSVSRFHWSFPNSRCKPRLKSNIWWDSGFSPALVVNCLYQQPGRCPPAHLLDLAVRRINQGTLFNYATDLAPCDLSASSASAIFESLSNSADYDWLQSPDAQ